MRAIRGRAVSWLGLIGVLVSGAGCSTNQIIDPLRAPGLLRQAQARPVPLRLLVAPMLDARLGGAAAGVGGAVTDAASEEGSDPSQAGDTVPVPRFELERFRGEMVEGLRAARVCSRVDKAPPLSAERGEAVVKDDAARAAFQAQTLADAAARGYDLLLQVRLLRYDLRFLGSTEYSGRHLLSILAFFNWYFPSWWIADAEFGCEVELEATLSAVGSEQAVIARRVYRGQSRLVLDEFERGLTWLGPLFLRSSLDDDNWSTVAQMVAPPARARVWESLAKDVKAVDPSAAALRARYLVAVGAGRFGQRHSALLQAEEDAKAFYDLWVESGVVPAKNARLLRGGEATKAGILGALGGFLKRARPRDLVCLYFAGYGAVAGGKPVLVPAGFLSSQAETSGLALSELARMLDGSSCRQGLIIDASFAGSSDRRVRSYLSGGVLSSDGFRGLRRPGRVWVFGGGREGLARSTELANGNFTGFLLENARSPRAPADATGLVTLNALFAKVRSNVKEEPFDPPQQPEWWGADAGPLAPGEVVIPVLLRRRSTASTQSAQREDVR